MKYSVLLSDLILRWHIQCCCLISYLRFTNAADWSECHFQCLVWVYTWAWYLRLLLSDSQIQCCCLIWVAFSVLWFDQAEPIIFSTTVWSQIWFIFSIVSLEIWALVFNSNQHTENGWGKGLFPRQHGVSLECLDYFVEKTKNST